MQTNYLQIRKKLYYCNKQSWEEDSFSRRSWKAIKDNYLINSIIDHGLSTHLFDRNAGVYTYNRKRSTTKRLDGLGIVSKKFNNKKLIKILPTKWKRSIKRSKLVFKSVIEGE